YSITYSPDGNRIATASADGTAKVWDARSGRVIRTVSSYPDKLRSVAFSPDGNRIATASKDKIAKVWDIDSGQVVLTLSGHTNSINTIIFSPSGEYIATASEDKTVRLHPILNIGDLKNIAQMRVARSLTTVEQRQYLLD
ncbi:uncharacterized protein METZ01_LOCUS329098, partial [marine metagenome]